MKFLIAFACLIAAALAAPSPADIELLKNAFTSELGGYNFEFEQSDGQKRSESGVVKNVGAEDEFVAVTGSFTFLGDDGQTYTVTYVADENGFQPSAPHLPVAPVV